MKLLENKSLTREQWLSLAKNELTSKVFKLSLKLLLKWEMK